MNTNLAHEFYKMTHQRSSWWVVPVLLGLMLYSSTPTAYITKGLVAQGFGAGQWTIIIMIALSANFVTMEYRNNTMTTLLYKSPNRQIVFFTKLIVLLLYGLFLLLISFLFALGLKLLLVNNRFSWEADFHQHTLINVLIINLTGVGIYLLFTITLSLLLVSLVKSNAAVIIIGLFIGFLGANISGVMMQAFPGLESVIAWNPLNMINVITQLSNRSVMKLTMLSNDELIIGNLIYAVIFLVAGLWAFKKRNQ